MPFRCNDCPTYIAQKAFLTLHMKSVVERKKPHDCNECRTSFEIKVYFNDHISAIHEGIKSSPNEKVVLPKIPMNTHVLIK